MTRTNRQLLTILALVAVIGAFAWQSGALTLDSAPLMEVAEVESAQPAPESSRLPTHVEAHSRNGLVGSERREVEGSESADWFGEQGSANTVALPEVKPAEPLIPGSGDILLNGYVLDRSGAEPGFDVDARCGEFRVKTKTDHLGNFQVRIPHGGNYWFTVNGGGRRLMMRRELSDRHGQYVELEFDGSQIEGLVQSVEGEALKGIQVSLTWVPLDNSSIPTYPAQAMTGEDGRFRFDHVPSGQFFVTANKSRKKGNEWQTAESEPFVVLRGVDPDRLVLELEPRPVLPELFEPSKSFEYDSSRIRKGTIKRFGEE